MTLTLKYPTNFYMVGRATVNSVATYALEHNINFVNNKGNRFKYTVVFTNGRIVNFNLLSEVRSAIFEFITTEFNERRAAEQIQVLDMKHNTVYLAGFKIAHNSPYYSPRVRNQLQRRANKFHKLLASTKAA